MFYLQYLGATFFDSDNENNLFQIAYSIVLYATCISNLILLPLVSEEFDDWSKALNTSMAAVTCTVATVSVIFSRIIVERNLKYKYDKFKTTLEGFEIYIPTTTTSMNCKTRFSFTVIFVMMIIVVPSNILKLYYIKSNHVNPFLISMYFHFYYFHNLSLCCTELHFAIQCFSVYLKFRDVNDKLQKVHCEHNRNYITRYPFIETGVETPGGNNSSPRTIVYERDFYCPKDKGYPLANTIELLRIKHWLTREAINDLNSIFGIQIGLSIITITTTALFDVYTRIFFTFTSDMFNKAVFRSNLLFVMWMFQYSFRYCLIVITSHSATKQAVKTKNIVTEMNYRHLDSISKEELQLFFNQLSTCSTDLTIYDIFTLNNNLITSALAAGATYILILVQFNSDQPRN